MAFLNLILTYISNMTERSCQQQTEVATQGHWDLHHVQHLGSSRAREG